MDPKVSVIIAAHNHAHFLPECLGSVKTQTYSDYEVIVIDNGSTDNTKDVVASIKWDKLRYHFQSDTGSVAGPRNTGIKIAKGKYVAFLDSDDMWLPEKLSETVDILESDPSIDIVTHDLEKFENGKNTGLLRTGPNNVRFFRALLYGNCVLGSATVAKRTVMEDINGFDPSKKFVHAEDYETWLRLAKKGKNFHCINRALGKYRIHGNNLSNDIDTAIRNEWNVLNKHLKDYVPGNRWDAFITNRQVRGYMHVRSFCAYKAKKRYFKAVSELFLSFISMPLVFMARTLRLSIKALSGSKKN